MGKVKNLFIDYRNHYDSKDFAQMQNIFHHTFLAEQDFFMSSDKFMSFVNNLFSEGFVITNFKELQRNESFFEKCKELLKVQADMDDELSNENIKVVDVERFRENYEVMLNELLCLLAKKEVGDG
jgi:hypothetical protein